ncbi:DNA polymerase Y family protein, partial [Methylobacterium sp. WL18]
PGAPAADRDADAANGGAPGQARDYYRVECAAGRRLWLYRDGPHAPGRPAAWFVHGVFP